MKHKLFFLMIFSAFSTSTLANTIPQEWKTYPCHAGKYISGIESNPTTGYSSIFLSDNIHDKTDASSIVRFAATDSSPSAKNMYNMAQNAMNLNYPILYARCDFQGGILYLAIKRDSH
ncbi:Uncharacterised protein [Yersinia intermedia]|uniref:hypothetical protein n=1 Tax=Yersinia intermedia TaxID=631 RepID=UPI0005E59E0D|nr:hypothetical protein [Yersinia intermedia]CND08298.1 Uncharacterised protein [Yersinia intermedia]CNH34735.1 Uncharacterised protein [Yersinia intermedia]